MLATCTKPWEQARARFGAKTKIREDLHVGKVDQVTKNHWMKTENVQTHPRTEVSEEAVVRIRATSSCGQLRQLTQALDLWKVPTSTCLTLPPLLPRRLATVLLFSLYAL